MTARPTIFLVAARWDEDARLWHGSCDELPAAAEAETLDALLDRIGAMAGDILPDNHPDLDPAAVFLQLTALREVDLRPAA